VERHNSINQKSISVVRKDGGDVAEGLGGRESARESDQAFGVYERLLLVVFDMATCEGIGSRRTTLGKINECR
jgi:hypothetical protein